MAKLTLNDITAGLGAATLINANNALIEAIVEKCLILDGTGSNVVTADIDMNGFDLLNLGNPISITGFNWEGDWATATLYEVGDVVNNGGTGYVCVEEHTSGTFATDLAAVKWQIVAEAGLPTQTGHANKYLTTDGTTASWEDASTVYLPLAGGTLTGTLTSVGITDTGVLDFSGATLAGGTPLVFEGATADAFETSLVITDPTADRTLTMPDADVDLTVVRTATTAVTGVSEHSTTAEMQADTPSSTLIPTVQAIRQGFRVLATLQASTSGTTIDFTSLPSWVTKITVTLNGVSTNGTSNPLFQLGDAGGIEATGYLGSGSSITTSVVTSNYTTGFGLRAGLAANILHGSITFTLMDSATFLWAANGVFGLSNLAGTVTTAGSKALSATLDRVRVTTVGGSDTFDAGNIGLCYE